MAILLFMVNYEIAESEPDEREKKKPIPNNQHGLMNKKIRAGRKPSSVLPVTREWWSFIWALDCSKARATYPEVSDGPSLPPCGGRFPMWSCSRRGFPSTRHRCRAWWALTPPFHPYPGTGRSSFLWHCPWGRPLSRFGTALPCGARTFLPPFPESDHLTRSEIKERLQNRNCKMQKSKSLPMLLICTLHSSFCLEKLFVNGFIGKRVR
jgi:hypothetical protein